jgi:hypothetical protein
MRRIVVGMPLAIIALGFGCEVALAEPTRLSCTNPAQPDNAPFAIILDQTGGKVTISNPAQQSTPANSRTYAATFGANEIRFLVNDWTYTIDRTSGVVTAAASGTAMHFPCQVAKRQF